MIRGNLTAGAFMYFGMTIESPDYNYSYLGGPVETFPAIPVSIVRSWDVWSPGNGQIEGLDWGSLNPSAGVYNWVGLDAWIADSKAHNAQMVYTFGDIPAWVYAEPTVAQAMIDFQTFVTDIVEQANGAIKYWEGLNEIDASGIPPAIAVQMQEIIYNTVHSLDPGGLVLSPTVSSAGADGEFAQFLADGGGNYFDIAALHGYGNSTGEGIATTVQDMQAMLAEYGLQNKPIWDTEWGLWGQTNLTATQQEAFVSTGLIVQAAAGVQTEIFYAYDNANSALYDTATGQLTAAGVAYQQTEQWLTGATEPSGYQLNGSVYTVQLIKNGQSDLLVWNSAGQSSYAAGSYTEYVNVEGQVEPIVNGEVTIGTVPVLLETSESAVVLSPTVVSVATSGTGITNGNGDLNAGHVVSLTLTLTMSEAVTVTGGTPTLTLNDGGTASYVSGSDSDALTFSYTVASGQNTPDLTVTTVNLNGATIQDGSGNNAAFTIQDGSGNNAAFTGTLTPTGTLQIDTTPPAAPVIASDTVNANDTVTLVGTAAANSTVTVYDGQTALGTTTANASGAWSYTTATLANGTQAFTATATDAAGNSAASSAVDPTINSSSSGHHRGTHGAQASGVSNNAISHDVAAASAATVDTVTQAAAVAASNTINADTSVTLGSTAEDSPAAVHGAQSNPRTPTASASELRSYHTGGLANDMHGFAAKGLVGDSSLVSSAVDPSISLPSSERIRDAEHGFQSFVGSQPHVASDAGVVGTLNVMTETHGTTGDATLGDLAAALAAIERYDGGVPAAVGGPGSIFVPRGAFPNVLASNFNTETTNDASRLLHSEHGVLTNLQPDMHASDTGISIEASDNALFSHHFHSHIFHIA
jgi:hypothetical protein